MVLTRLESIAGSVRGVSLITYTVHALSSAKFELIDLSYAMTVILVLKLGEFDDDTLQPQGNVPLAHNAYSEGVGSCQGKSRVFRNPRTESQVTA